ncbi:MAG: hypothetical protein GX144_03110 [Clostridiaceae bacterium]|nr:hypothetical protein [Clostridiaceae bacterium]
MDWSRAKNIILIVLVLLNIFLFVNILSVKDPLNLAGQYQVDAKQALQSAGVVLSSGISFKRSKPLGRISYIETDPAVYTETIRRLIGPFDGTDTALWEKEGKSLSFQDEFFIYTDEAGQEIFPVEDQKRLDRRLSAWIKENFLPNERFIQDRFEQDGNTITARYIRCYKNMPLFSHGISLTIVDGKLKKAEGSLKIFQTIKVSTSADEIITANIAMITNKDKVQGIVNSIELGYLCLQSDDLYDTPVWRITLATGENVWFNAYTGEYLKSD